MQHLEITMPDGCRWAVPAHVIQTHAADNDVEISDEKDIVDWAENNMNWFEVVELAVMTTPPEDDYQDGWVNGEKTFIDR
ncbi:hypothetical protein [Yersinia mollaretii]|uniref:hypothetical protein n=1 Tax=Yersinia mollaretii TaxID=33060 RepID=UPI001C93D846|nr:hypothetical protein [Yersinia mollaretii]